LATGEVIRLFHPRTDVWSEHFRWDVALVIPRTTIGRVTIAVLAMNHPDQLDVRVSLIREGKLKLDEG